MKITCNMNRRTLPIFPWRRAWQPTPVFLPGDSHGQRIPWTENPCWATVHRVTESDMTEVTYHAQHAWSN